MQAKAISIITAGKQSLGQGNVFTPVCHSVHGGLGFAYHRSHDEGVCIQEGFVSRWSASVKRGGGGWADPPSDTMRYGKSAGGMHPTGMHFCFIFY